MAAFRAAIAAGHGIECDVRISRDSVAFVFHDDDLGRMTGRAGPIADQYGAQLDGARLPDGGAVPRLSDLLALCDGMTPLLVEIKTDGWRVAKIADIPPLFAERRESLEHNATFLAKRTCLHILVKGVFR